MRRLKIFWEKIKTKIKGFIEAHIVAEYPYDDDL